MPYTMPPEEAMKDELRMMLDSLRGHILWSREQRLPMPFSYGKTKTDAPRIAVEAAISPDIMERAGIFTGLEEVRNNLGDCRRCSLSSMRKNLVFGEGNPHTELVFVGEAPGADEDLEGKPFVGRAGQLLTKIIVAMGLKREDVYICNIVKCRPPGNRNPEPPEIAACEPFLISQLQAIEPKVICALGAFAAKTLLKNDAFITTLRGRFHTYGGIKVMPTFHPAYLLRNPAAKKQVWEDMQMIMKELNSEQQQK